MDPLIFSIGMLTMVVIIVIIEIMNRTGKPTGRHAEGGNESVSVAALINSKTKNGAASK